MKATPKRLLPYIAVFLAGGMIGTWLYDRRVSQQLSGIYRYDVEVSVIDANTGEAVPDLKVEAPAVSSASLFQQTSGMMGGSDGVVGIRGIAYEPRTWSIGCVGYESASLIVDRDSPLSMTIKLEPTRPNKSE